MKRTIRSLPSKGKPRWQALFLLLPFFWTTTANAADPEKGTRTGASLSSQIVLTVGADPISRHVWDQRVRLAGILSGKDTSPSPAERNLVLRSLVDAKIQQRICKEAGIIASETEVDQAIANIERANGMPAGALSTLIKQKGGDVSQFREQIATHLAWGEYIRARYLKQARPSHIEVARALERYKRGRTKERYHLVEIVIQADERLGGERAAQDQVRSLVERLRQGAPFMLLAQQFSQAPTRVRGGDMGWIELDALDADLRPLIEKSVIGGLIGPVRMGNRFIIIGVMDKQGPQDAKQEVDMKALKNALMMEKIELLSVRELERLRLSTPIVVFQR